MADDVRKAAADAARSMRDRAIRVLLGRAVIPCALMMRGAANEIESLPLLEEFDVANQPQQQQQSAQASAQHQQMAAALGIDLSKIDWGKIAREALQFFLSLLQQHGPALAASCPDEDTKKCCTQCTEAAALALESARLSLTCAHECTQ